MCGRYALGLPPSAIRQRIRDAGMPSDDAPDDDDVRESYNFAPGYYGLVYRADVPDYGAGQRRQQQNEDGEAETGTSEGNPEQPSAPSEPKYKLQSMKWGLVPFWTKRNPDYGTLMRTINCRDDSLAVKGGMWQTMKQRKRCIVICQGFYEWLKKNDGKEKIPHFIKRKDGELMCMAGLWDCVKYEDAEDKLYTYTIITTDANKQVSALHDRMPVILNSGSKEMFTWLDSKRSEWSMDLQNLLEPFKGELEIYPVSKEVGKVGNNSPNFIIPVDSKENKNNIANFFGNQQKLAKAQKEGGKTSKGSENEPTSSPLKQKSETIATAKDESENNAPNPTPTLKRTASDAKNEATERSPPAKSQKLGSDAVKSPNKSSQGSPTAKNRPKGSPVKVSPSKSSPIKSSPGNSRITSFFKK